MKIRITTLFACLLLLSAPLLSQDRQADSLCNLLAEARADTAVYDAAIELAWHYMYSNSDSALHYGKLALEAAQKNSPDLRTASAYNALGVCYIVKAEYYEALRHLAQAEEAAQTILQQEPGNEAYMRRLVAIYTNIGNIHYYKGEYEKSLAQYLKALELVEKIDYNSALAVILSNVAASYKDLLNYEKALEYNYRALAQAQQTQDPYSLSQSFNNLGSVYYSLKEYDSAYYYFDKSKTMNENTGAEYELINNYVNLADVFRETEQYDSSLYYYNKSIAISKKLNSIDGQINCYYMLGQLYKKRGLFQKAIGYFEKSREMADRSGTIRFVMLSNEELSNIYRQQGKYKLALDCFTVSSQIRDSIFNAESDARIADMEAKYQSQKKEEEIAHLKETTLLQETRARTNRIILLGVIIILALVIILVVIAFRSAKNKQLAEKRRLQQEAERKVLDAVMETEFKERKRFAEDLHDGLGVLLSTIKLYVNELSGDNPTAEQQKLISETNNLLDEAITNARQISNNIMPASLKRDGLEATIRSFSDKINASGKIRIEIRSDNFRKHYRSLVEVTLYRVLTEMINNSLKHAEAGRIEITFAEKNGKIRITYKDDGKGFDYESMSKSTEKGMGLDNMRNRINSIGGKCRIKSKPGKGFFAEIEVDLS